MYWKKPGVEGFSKLAHAPDAKGFLLSRLKEQGWMNGRICRILVKLPEKFLKDGKEFS